MSGNFFLFGYFLYVYEHTNYPLLYQLSLIYINKVTKRKRLR